MDFSLNCRGRFFSLDRPRIMGILNITPDSFSDGGDYNSLNKALDRVGAMLEAGAEIIDVGGYSSRPFAEDVSPQEELDRIYKICEQILIQYPQAILSIDTFRSFVAKPLLELGAHIINDISAGNLDEEMMACVASFGDVPYIMMHMQGNPTTMQKNPTYAQIVPEVQDFFVEKIGKAREVGIKDLVLDPGFGFGKKREHNYQLLYELDKFQLFELPLLCGISRKSMMYKFFDTDPGDVVEISTALHLKCLELGANIIRVHDIREAQRIVQLFSYLQDNGIV